MARKNSRLYVTVSKVSVHPGGKGRGALWRRPTAFVTSTPTVTSSNTRLECSITPRPSTGTASGTSRPTPTARSGSASTAPAARLSGCRGRRASATRTWPRFCAARSSTARCGPRPGTPPPGWATWTSTTSTSPSCIRRPCSDCRATSTSSSARCRPGPTTTGVRITSSRVGGACSVPGPCRPCTIPTTWRAWLARSTGWPSCRGWCRCSCGPTRRSSGSSSTTRCTTRSGLRPRTRACRSGCIRSWLRTSRGCARGSGSGSCPPPRATWRHPTTANPGPRLTRAPRAWATSTSRRRSPTPST